MVAYTLRVFAALAFCTYLVASQSSTAAPRVCTEPPIVFHANLTRTGLSDGAIATYTCYAGYEATGSIHKTCRDGNWVSSGFGLSCNAITCPRPPTILHASYRSYSSNGYLVGTSVSYNCYSGYYINETNVDEITCLANQSWSLPYPECIKKDCGTPPLGDGLNVSYTQTDYYSGAVYTCDEGYDLYRDGYRQRSDRYTVRCLSTGTWATLPTCQPKDCGYPSLILNGIRISNGDHKYRDIAMYECDHGYQLNGNATVTCMATGRWSSFPTCERRQCPAPPLVKNATFNFNGKAYFGNSTTYTCTKGHELIGAPLVACQADGTWSEAPVCAMVDCRSPPAIHFGTHTWTSTTYNSVAEYTCDKGYKLIGVSQIFCNADGRWSEFPACEMPPGQSGSSSSLTALAVACVIFGVITLLCLIGLIYKLFIAGRTSKLFSYASYKNGDDVINSGM